MRLLERKVDYASRADEFTLYQLGDTHRGSKHHDEAALVRDVKEILDDKHGLWVGTGDWLDAILPGDKRFHTSEIHPDYLTDIHNAPRHATYDLAEILAPIADKCLGIVRGNHDMTLEKQHYYSVGHALHEHLELPYCGGKGFIRLRFNRGRAVTTLAIHLWHGKGGGTSPASALNCLAKQMQAFPDMDITCIGHFHKKAYYAPEELTIPRTGKLTLRAKSRFGQSNGSYLRGYADGGDSYVDDAGYPPMQQGMVRYVIRPGAHDRAEQIEVRSR